MSPELEKALNAAGPIYDTTELERLITDLEQRAAALTAERERAVKAERDRIEVRWQATQRAIRRWQEANPGNDLTWPDSADLTVWLLEQLTAERTAREKAEWELKHWQDIAELNAQVGKELGERAEKAEAELATLMDPAALHINALRLLTPAQRLHLGGQAMQEAVAKAKAETKAVKASVESTLQLQRERHERLVAEARAAGDGEP